MSGTETFTPPEGDPKQCPNLQNRRNFETCLQTMLVDGNGPNVFDLCKRICALCGNCTEATGKCGKLD